MIFGAPYALHLSAAASSFAGSHALATLTPSGLRGRLGRSPLGGVTIRNRQSSETIDTQYPVRSMGAASFGVLGAAPRPRPWAPGLAVSRLLRSGCCADTRAVEAAK